MFLPLAVTGIKGFKYLAALDRVLGGGIPEFGIIREKNETRSQVWRSGIKFTIQPNKSDQFWLHRNNIEDTALAVSLPRLIVATKALAVS